MKCCFTDGQIAPAEDVIDPKIHVWTVKTCPVRVASSRMPPQERLATKRHKKHKRGIGVDSKESLRRLEKSEEVVAVVNANEINLRTSETTRNRDGAMIVFVMVGPLRVLDQEH